MADHQWFYQKDSLIGTTDSIGPMPEGELIALAKDGKFKRETLVSCQTRTNGAWHQVQQIPALLKAMEQGIQARKEEKDRQAREKEAERQARDAERQERDGERQRQAELRQAESQQRAEVTSQQREVLRQQREQEEAIRRAMFKPRAYPAMGVITSLLYFMAILAGASFILHLIFTVIITSAAAHRDDGLGITIASSAFTLLISFVFHTVFIVSFVAAAESIRVVIDIQHNTQETAFYMRAVAHNSSPVAPLQPDLPPVVATGGFPAQAG